VTKLTQKQWIYGGGAAAVLVLVVVLLATGAFSSGGLSEGKYAVEVKPTDRVMGKADAPAVVIEYASMTCPHCARVAHDVIPKLVEKYVNTGKVRFVFREYPLDGAARMAAALARCVPEDKFFSFIDLLFANQDKWLQDFDQDSQLTREDVIEGLAQMGRFAGLSRERVEACSSDAANLKVVDDNWKEAQTLYGVDSTPTFIIGGNVHKGELSFETIENSLKPLLPD